MTMTGRGMMRLKTSLISMSDARSFGPVWYQPIMRSLAADTQDTDEHGARGTGARLTDR